VNLFTDVGFSAESRWTGAVDYINSWTYGTYDDDDNHNENTFAAIDGVEIRLRILQDNGGNQHLAQIAAQLSSALSTRGSQLLSSGHFIRNTAKFATQGANLDESILQGKVFSLLRFFLDSIAAIGVILIVLSCIGFGIAKRSSPKWISSPTTPPPLEKEEYDSSNKNSDDHLNSIINNIHNNSKIIPADCESLEKGQIKELDGIVEVDIEEEIGLGIEHRRRDIIDHLENKLNNNFDRNNSEFNLRNENNNIRLPHQNPVQHFVTKLQTIIFGPSTSPVIASSLPTSSPSSLTTVEVKELSHMTGKVLKSNSIPVVSAVPALVSNNVLIEEVFNPLNGQISPNVNQTDILEESGGGGGGIELKPHVVDLRELDEIVRQRNLDGVSSKSSCF